MWLPPTITTLLVALLVGITSGANDEDADSDVFRGLSGYGSDLYKALQVSDLYYGCFEAPSASVERRSSSVTTPTTTTTVANGAQVQSGNAEQCIAWCGEQHFSLAAVAPRVCECARDLTNFTRTAQRPLDRCHTTCPYPKPADASQRQPRLRCGSASADQLRSLYSTEHAPAADDDAVRSLTVTAVTNTSASLAWMPPPWTTSATVHSYSITARLLEAPYAANETLDRVTERELQTTADSAALVWHEWLGDLRPGALYNISVAATLWGTDGASDHHPGALRSALVRTHMGWPQPPVPVPVILGAGLEHQRTLELPVVSNTVGPVTRVRLVVVFEDAGGLVRLDFDPALVTGWAQAQELGLHYYVAAELEPYARVRRFTLGDGRTYQGYVNRALPTDAHVHVLLGLVATEQDERTGEWRTLVRYSESTHEQHGGLPNDGGGGKPAEPVILSGGGGGGGTEDSPNTILVLLIVACVLFGVLLVISIGVYVVLRIVMERRIEGPRYDQHEMRRPNGETRDNNGFVGDRGSQVRRLEEMMGRLPEYQRIQRKELTLNAYAQLGAGQFGDVMAGAIQDVEVKLHLIGDDLEPLELSHFLYELDDLLRIEAHPNLLHFIGVSQSHDFTYIVFEATRCSLKKLLIDGRRTTNAARLADVSEEFVLRILYNVADAMEFVSAQGFRHRQLCAYNVCITSADDVRLVTFDAKPFDEHGNAVNIARWSAPEMLRHKTHAKHSDVWSFGCLMWEACTLGGTLYPDVRTEDLGGRLKAGLRPARTALFYDDVYQLMLNCWQADQAERPGFRELADTLRTLLSSPRHVLTFDRAAGAGAALPVHLPLLELEAESTGGATGTSSSNSQLLASSAAAGARP